MHLPRGITTSKRFEQATHVGAPRQIRARLKLTTADIAESLGYHPNYVRKLIQEEKILTGCTASQQLQSIILWGIEHGRF